MTTAQPNSIASRVQSTAPAAGTIGRRRAVPGGRAVVGSFLVVAAALAVFAGWLKTSGGTGERYVVAGHQLSAGTLLRADDLALATMKLPGPSTRTHAFQIRSDLVGRVLAAPVGSGELVQASAVLGRGSSFGERQVSLTVDASDVAGLQPGQPVDVLVTHGTATTARTDLVVAGAHLLRVARPDSSTIGGRSGVVLTIGVANFSDIQAVIHAMRTGQVDVVPGSAADRFVPASP